MNAARQYEYNKIKGFSQLFIDYIEGKTFINSRFPNNSGLFTDSAYLDRKAKEYPFRNQLHRMILESMSCIDLSEVQSRNIEKLKQPNSLTVTTGQQVGYLGGPIYTLLKIFSAVRLAKELSEKHTDLEFVPVFWLEDNDHDSQEASYIYCPDKTSSIQRFSCINNFATSERTIVSEKVFDETITERIENFLVNLNETEFTSEVRELMTRCYIPGNRWNDAFLAIINYIAGTTGILFIKASQIIKSGFCKPLILKEITSKGASDRIILEANDLLTENGYHIQAKHSLVNLFYHSDYIRQRIVPDGSFNSFVVGSEKYSFDELVKSAEDNPESFSPNVLLRPVFQDYALPNSSYIGGPSEIGYISQTKELFEYFNVHMAAYLSRHSATIIDRKTSRILAQNELEPEFFFNPFSYIEYDLLNSLKDKDLSDKLEAQKSIIFKAFEEISKLSVSADPTLVQTVKAAETKAEQLTDMIIKKLASALKKNNEVMLSRYKYCSTMLFPTDTLQERIFTPFYFINLYGKSVFVEKLNEICIQNRDHHLFVNI